MSGNNDNALNGQHDEVEIELGDNEPPVTERDAGGDQRGLHVVFGPPWGTMVLVGAEDLMVEG